jgi:hypothetical protein
MAQAHILTTEQAKELCHEVGDAVGERRQTTWID